MRPVRGYTLMEVLITLTLIAIMAGIAIPTFTRTVERSYWRAAADVLLTVYAGEQVYHSLNDEYNAASGGSGWNAIYMDNPNGTSLPATFAVTKSGTGAGATFKATGTRTSTGKQMWIDHNRLLCNGEPPGSCGTWTKP
jgi:type IV pilus assembly protein PilE